MKPDKLEQFILENRESFDPFEPSPETWEKIRKRPGRLRRIDWRDVAWKAAAVVIIFTASYFFHDYMSSRNGRSAETALPADDPMIRELLDAEVFYTARIKSAKDELFRITDDHPMIRREVDDEFASLDQVYRELRDDLKDDADNTEVIEAMIQNYRVKLEILEELLFQVKEAGKTQNESQDENKSLHI